MTYEPTLASFWTPIHKAFCMQRRHRPIFSPNLPHVIISCTINGLALDSDGIISEGSISDVIITNSCT